jgi:hypothetical protein
MLILAHILLFQQNTEALKVVRMQNVPTAQTNKEIFAQVRNAIFEGPVLLLVPVHAHLPHPLPHLQREKRRQCVLEQTIKTTSLFGWHVAEDTRKGAAR